MKISKLPDICRFITSHPLNRERKLAALANFARWQIASRLRSKPVVYEWVAGTKLWASAGDTAVTSNIYCGLSEFTDMMYLLHVTGPEDVFIDVGANVGIFTVLASGVRGARAYAFEPVPSIYKQLIANIELNNLSSRVVPLNMGAADKDGELAFTSDIGQYNHVASESDKAEAVVKVPVRSLDSVLANEQPTIMKVDVEGFESAVIDGANSVLARPSLHSVIMEINECCERYGVTQQEIFQKMLSRGFTEYEYEPAARKLVRKTTKGLHTGNALFLRNEALINEKLAKASAVTIRNRAY